MSRRILNAHTGECLFADLDTYETCVFGSGYHADFRLTADSFESLKQWVADSTGITEKRQVLLTPKGKQVKFQTLRNEVSGKKVDPRSKKREAHAVTTQEDIFVYDRDLIQVTSGQSEQSSVQVERLLFSDLQAVPAEPANVNDGEAWLEAARARLEWAVRCQQISKEALDKGRGLASEIAIIQQGTAIAVDNLKQHLASLQQRQRQAKDWVDSLVAAQTSFEEEHEALGSRLASVPTVGQLQRFLKSRPTSQKQVSSLLDLLGSTNLGELSLRAKKVSRKLKKLIEDIGANHAEASERGGSIIQSFSNDFVSSTGDLLEILDSHAEEQSILCGKISDDCTNVLRDNARDLSQLPKLFNRHDKNLVPPIRETYNDIQATVQQISERKQRLVLDAMICMQRVSGAESIIGSISQSYGQLELNQDEDATLEALDGIYRLPSVYGSLLVELVRRREWTEKMSSDSTSLAEEMATYRDEEERRRKKWLRSMAQYLASELGGDVMGIDVSVRTSGDALPAVSRDDATHYVEVLKNVGGFEDAVQDLAPMLKAMDAPSKQQTRRANAFRNGSVNDTPFGRNSLLLRGDDDLIKTLQTEKAKLEEKLKGSDSRVRRLEDLLHRQSQIQSRPSSRGVGAPFPYDRQVTTPTTLDGFSKVPVQPHSPGHYGSRRSSLVAQFQEQNPLTERVLQLEAELNSEKSKTAKLQDMVNKHGTDEEALKGQIQDAASTKQDLMDNFQAQQNEFEGERRLLEDENRKLKVKLDELEEDFDRILGSHDNARLGLDERTKAFEQELRNHRERAADEVNKVNTENEKLRKDHVQLQSEIDVVRKTAEENGELKAQALARVDELQAKVQDHDRTRSAHDRSLRAVHSQLANEENPPAGFDALVGAVEQLSSKASSHLRDVQQALEKARSENAIQGKQLEGRLSEIGHLKSRVEEEELEVFSLREEVADRKARYASLESELEDQRQDLENLRSKHSQDESLLDSLRKQLRAEEKNVRDLNSNITKTKTLHSQAENHLSRLNERVGILEDVRNKQASQLEARARRAEEVSSRLHAQNELLLKLLSQVGFTATRQNGSYNFERTSRLANGGSTMIDSSPAISRTQTGNLTSTQEEQKPKHLQWASSEDGESEKGLFQEYMAEIGLLKMDVVFETLVKRFKDVEHTARKWQREAKNYRERFHKAQFEAQNKIAFRTFKEGDLALFLPTRNQAPKRSWAAFNVGAPHYFLREQEHHTLKSRDWLVARISNVEERAVDLSKNLGSDVAMNSAKEGGTTGEDDIAAAAAATAAATEDENPFGLSDGLRWYYLDAAEERLGAAPTTPGLGKSTVASAPEHATGSNVPASKKKPGEVNAAAKVLTKSLDSRRSSTNSKKSTAGAMASPANATGTFETGHGDGGGAAAAAASAVASGTPGGGLGSDRSSLRRPGSKDSVAQQEGRREQQGWSSLWSVDVSLESGRKDGAK